MNQTIAIETHLAKASEHYLRCTAAGTPMRWQRNRQLALQKRIRSVLVHDDCTLRQAA